MFVATAGMEGAGPRLGTFLSYAKVELVPPTPGEVGAAIGGFSKVVKTGVTGGFTKLTVKVSVDRVSVVVSWCCIWCSEGIELFYLRLTVQHLLLNEP